MTSADPLVISGAVEGLVDEVVLRRIVQLVGATLGPVYGKNGKRDLRQRLGGYNRAARFRPWIVLVDLDRDADCAPPLRDAWLPKPAPSMYFRVVVRAVEAWLLADRERLSALLSIPSTRIPREPEAEPDPKRIIVDLAMHSRRRDIHVDMVPRAGSGRAVGPAYTSRLIEFVMDTAAGWRPDVNVPFSCRPRGPTERTQGGLGHRDPL